MYNQKFRLQRNNQTSFSQSVYTLNLVVKAIMNSRKSTTISEPVRRVILKKILHQSNCCIYAMKLKRGVLLSVYPFLEK